MQERPPSVVRAARYGDEVLIDEQARSGLTATRAKCGDDGQPDQELPQAQFLAQVDQQNIGRRS